MIREYIEKILEKENLSINEAFEAMNSIMSGQVSNSQLAGFLTSLRAKGETSEEIAGFARAMRSKSIRLDTGNDKTIDVCGTGGDNSRTFNISTAAAFVVAGAGIKVAKHGNKSISSNSGSADVLMELGININLDADQSRQTLDETGICFLFAPAFHPAMRYAATVRKELGIKTVFNLLGPLANPAGTKRQLVGVYNNQYSKLLSNASRHLEMERICFVCTGNRLDEITLTDETTVNEFNADKAPISYTISNETFDYPKADINELKGYSPRHNAEIIMELFTAPKRNSIFNVVAANSALALYCAGYSKDLNICRDAAENSIMSKAALGKLKALKTISRKFS